MKPLIRSKLIWALLIFLQFSFLTVEDLYSQSGAEYLDAAEKTAGWLSSIVQEKNDGLCWPASDISTYNTPGLCTGAAGVGLFYLKLYQVTGKSSYLDIAEKVGDYIYYEHRYVNMHGPDWFTGAASGGEYFLALFKETGKSEYLQKAEYFAEWLIDNKYTGGGGYYWKHYPEFEKIYTGIAHGAAGIGLFFLNLYEQAHNPLYLEYAEKALVWMSNHIVRFDVNSIGWKRLTTDNFAYHLWCGGSTGIVFLPRSKKDIDTIQF